MDRFTDSGDVRAQVLDSVPRAVHVVTEMLNETSGLWEVTAERVALLREHRDRLPEGHREAVDEMLGVDGKLWQCRAEYMSALQEISLINQRPGAQDLSDIVEAMKEGAFMDGVSDKDWFQEAVAFLERMISHGDLKSQPAPLDDPESYF